MKRESVSTKNSTWINYEQYVHTYYVESDKSVLIMLLVLAPSAGATASSANIAISKKLKHSEALSTSPNVAMLLALGGEFSK